MGKTCCRLQSCWDMESLASRRMPEIGRDGFCASNALWLDPRRKWENHHRACRSNGFMGLAGTFDMQDEDAEAIDNWRSSWNLADCCTIFGWQRNRMCKWSLESPLELCHWESTRSICTKNRFGATQWRGGFTRTRSGWWCCLASSSRKQNRERIRIYFGECNQGRLFDLEYGTRAADHSHRRLHSLASAHALATTARCKRVCRLRSWHSR